MLCSTVLFLLLLLLHIFEGFMGKLKKKNILFVSVKFLMGQGTPKMSHRRFLKKLLFHQNNSEESQNEDILMLLHNIYNQHFQQGIIIF